MLNLLFKIWWLNSFAFARGKEKCTRLFFSPPLFHSFLLRKMYRLKSYFFEVEIAKKKYNLRFSLPRSFFFLKVMNEIYKREDISFLFYVIKFIITHEIRG